MHSSKKLKLLGFLRCNTINWEDLSDMPEENKTFIYNRVFADWEMNVLRAGFNPTMDDKLLIYMEGDTLYAHRFSTGHCLFTIDIRSDNNHVVTANCDLTQSIWCDTVEGYTDLITDYLNYWLRENIPENMDAFAVQAAWPHPSWVNPTPRKGLDTK